MDSCPFSYKPWSLLSCHLMPSVHPPSVRSPDQENGSARTQCKCAPGKSRYLQRLKALGSYDYSRVKLQPPLKHSGQDVGIFRNYGANSFKHNVSDHHYLEIIYLECVFCGFDLGSFRFMDHFSSPALVAQMLQYHSLLSIQPQSMRFPQGVPPVWSAKTGWFAMNHNHDQLQVQPSLAKDQKAKNQKTSLRRSHNSI